jgi:HEAT repeat protein
MDDAEWDGILADLRSLDMDRALQAIRTMAEQAVAADIPRLEHLVRHGEDFFVREAAATPLARLAGARALPLLFRAMDRGQEEDHDNDGLEATIIELLQTRPQDVAPVLLRLVRAARRKDRANAAWSLGYLPAEVAVEPLLEAVHDAAPQVRGGAVGSLASFAGDKRVLPVLLDALQDCDEGVRVVAASALGYCGDARAVPALREALRDPCERVRFFAGHALQHLGDGAAVGPPSPPSSV